MRKSYCFFFYILIFIVTTSVSQEHVKKHFLVAKDYTVIGATMFDFNQIPKDSILQYEEISKQYLKTLDRKKERYKAMGTLQYIINANISLKRIDTALVYLFQGLEMPDAKTSKAAIDLHWEIFRVFNYSENFVGQLEQLKPLEELGTKFNFYRETDPLSLKKLRGDVLSSAGYYKEASTYYQQYLLENSLHINPVKYAVIANDLACVYEELHKKDSVLKYRQSALKILNSKRPNPYNIGYKVYIRDYIIIHDFWYHQLFTKENLEFAENFLKNALLHYSNESHTAVFASHFIGTYHFKKKQYKKALNYIDKALEIGKNKISLKKTQELYLLKSRILDKLGNEEGATKNLEIFKRIKINRLAKNRTIDLTRYEVDEITNQKEKAEFLAKESTSQRNNTTYLLILISIILAITMIAFSVTKRKNKRIKIAENEVKQKLKEKEFLLQELNHRVKNNLALILSLVKFQYYEIEEPIYKDKFKSLENRIHTIASAHEQLIYDSNNLEEDDFFANNYLSKIAKALVNIATRKVIFNLNANNIQLNIDTMLPIGILINELISNSIKHAISNTELVIVVELSLDNNIINLTYKDSGIAFKETKNTKSLGVSIINSMVKQLRGTIERVNSEYTISLQLKNSEK